MNNNMRLVAGARCVLILFLFAAALTMHSIGEASAADAGAALKIHMVSGSKEYKSEESLKKLERHLEKNFNVACTASWGRDGAKELENLDAIESADLLIVFARRLKLGDEQMQVIQRHWEAGKPVVGIRTAGHAFSREVNEVFDRKVLGGNYTGHFGREDLKVTNVPEAADHPVLDGVGVFTSSKLYKAGELADDTIVLQIGDIGKAQHPVTIVHTYNGGRMFFTALGVPSDFENENFVRMLENAIFWTTERERENVRRTSL